VDVHASAASTVHVDGRGAPNFLNEIPPTTIEAFRSTPFAIFDAESST